MEAPQEAAEGKGSGEGVPGAELLSELLSPLLVLLPLPLARAGLWLEGARPGGPSGEKRAVTLAWPGRAWRSAPGAQASPRQGERTSEAVKVGSRDGQLVFQHSP